MIDKDLFNLLGKNKKYIFIIVFLQLIGLLANLSVTISICFCIKFVATKAQPLLYLYPAIGFFVGLIIRFFTTKKIGDIKETLSSKVKKDLRERTYNKIVELGVQSTDNISLSGLTQVSLEGIEQLELYFAVYLPQFFFAMISPLILFFVCVWIDWRTALVLLACVPIIPISIIAVSKYAKKIFAKYWGQYTSMGDKFLDSVQGLKELKIFQADEIQQDKMNKNAENFRKITMKVLVMQLASTTIMDLVAYGGAALGIAVAIYSVICCGLSPFYLLFFILVAVEFFLPLRAFGSAFHIAMNGVSAGKQILALFNISNPLWGNEKVYESEIKLSNITFSYDGTRDVLKNIDMTFPEKGMTAIVGESGSGKSTIVNMLLGGYKAKSGKILVGGIPLEDISRESYYSNVALVSYNTYIFNQSIRDNFLLAKNNVTDEQIYDALKKVNLEHFVRENGGLNKIITEDGNNISGGQKQRLALAIGLIADKKIYIFDEATSNIDIESEQIIMKNIKNISKNKCVIVISHRLANVVFADNIYFIANGEVKESGDNNTLLNNKQGYERLFSMQKELEEGYAL